MKISFHLHVNQNQFSYERISTWTRFEKEAQGNLEMVYLFFYHNINVIEIFFHSVTKIVAQRKSKRCI